MKSIIKLCLVFTGLAVFFASCDKPDDLPFYGTGTAPVLTASATTIAPQPADSNNVALTLNWSNPQHATDSGNIKYTIQIDSAGKNFSRAETRVVNGQTSTSFTAKELNNILLGKGYAFNVPVDMDVRIISSYANNNEQLSSNTVRVKMTPYKIPPKVVLPTSGRLFIVGSATQGGWNNPVPVPSQEFTRIDETTWGGIFDLKANQSYLLLPVNNNNWDVKFGAAGSNNSNNPLGDAFTVGGGDLLAPANSGLHKVIFDFQTGRFTVTPFTQQHGLPTQLFIVGDATPGGWSNPVPVPAQRFTRVNATTFEITIQLTAGRKYLFLPENGSWDRKFGDSEQAGNTKLTGTFKPEGADFASPDVSGTYKITVDFLNNTYKLLKM